MPKHTIILDRLKRRLGPVLCHLYALGLISWSSVLIYYSPLPGKWFRFSLSILFLIIAPIAFLTLKNWQKLLKTLSILTLGWTIIWNALPPSQNRNWQDRFAELPQITLNGDIAKVSKLRHFQVRSSSDYTINYEEQSYDLSKIEGTDFLVSHWGNLQTVGHTFFSFRFTDGKVLCLSVEARREKGEDYSPLDGIFKQYELIYVLGDERDLIGARCKYFDEEIYLYETRLNSKDSRQLLTSLLQGAEKLNKRPKFYNTLWRNCTTKLIDHLNTIEGVQVDRHPKTLLNGLSDQLAYDRGLLANDLSFPALKHKSYISDIVINTELDENFSKNIRR